MANEVRAPIGALYVDNVRYDDDEGNAALINVIPAHGEEDVGVARPIRFTVAGLTGGAVDATTILVYVTLASDSLRVLAYSGPLGAFQNGFNGTMVARQSPGSGVNDELVFNFYPPVDFLSLDFVTVEVEAEVVGVVGLQEFDYSFTIEDVTAPEIESIFFLDPYTAKVKFDEPVLQQTTPGGSLFYEYHEGGVEILTANTVRVMGTLSETWMGQWSCLMNSVYPYNNGYRKITAVSPSTNIITLDITGDRGGMDADDGRDMTESGSLFRRRDIIFSVSPYSLSFRSDDEADGRGQLDAERIQCAFTPAIKSLAAMTSDQLPVGEDVREYALVTFHDMISLGRMYTLECNGVEDLWENVCSDIELDFTSPTFNIPGDTLGFWSDGILAPTDKLEDLMHTGEHRKLHVVLQDALNCLLYHNQVIERLMDSHQAPSDWIEHRLYSIGNPFTFQMTSDRLKRLLCDFLPDKYRLVGTVKGIKQILKLVLGYEFDIQPFIVGDHWILGDSVWGLLGQTTVLGPGTDWEKNAYQVISPVDLTDTQRAIVTEICTWTDKMNMHLVRILEPSTYTGTGTYTGASVYWVLGTHALGVSTTLGP